MSTLPERISIKRRRHDEPVETLYLEQGTGPDRKRRVTDFYFQRLRDETIAPISQREHSPSLSSAKPSQTTAPGIPPVRWTSPGDEKRDYEKIKATLKAQSETFSATDTQEQPLQAPSSTAGGGSQSAPSTPALADRLQRARRFHLARQLSSALSPSSSGGIRKQKPSIRPPLATFVERYGAPLDPEQNPLYKAPPVDKMLDVPKVGSVEPAGPGNLEEPSLETLRTSKRSATNTFLQTGSKGARKGTSIRDHPSTWNHESDQLADELAALAMEFDPEIQDKTEPVVEMPTGMPGVESTGVTPRPREDDFVYETYIRLRYDDETERALALVDNNMGVLVIEDEDQDLWQKYIDSDDDTDWDEEDSNAEDNPSNDYPEDEVSSDDEYGYNPYQYRHDRSDDDAFDDADDGDDERPPRS